MKSLILSLVVVCAALSTACAGGNPLSPTVHAAPLPSTAVVFVASDPAPVVEPVVVAPVPLPAPVPMPKPTPAPAPTPTPALVPAPVVTPAPRPMPVPPPPVLFADGPCGAVPCPPAVPALACPAGQEAILRGGVHVCEVPLPPVNCPAGTHPVLGVVVSCMVD